MLQRYLDKDDEKVSQPTEDQSLRMCKGCKLASVRGGRLKDS